MTSVNVFGNPVTQGDRNERAQRAYREPNAGGKRDQALAHARRLKASFGNGVSTLAIFYNATGEPLVYVLDHDFFGRMFSRYPTRVQNGQWGAFLHTKRPVVASGSQAYVVYRVRMTDNEHCHQLIGWDNPWLGGVHPNRAYCEIFNDGVTPNPNDVSRRMSTASLQHTASRFSMFTFATIQRGTSPIYQATLTLADVSRSISVSYDIQEPEESLEEPEQSQESEESEPTSA